MAPIYITALRTAQRSFSTTTPSLYQVSHSLKADIKPQVPAEQLKPQRQAAPIPGATSIVRKIAGKSPGTIDSYLAYDKTLKLMKECARPGEYKIPEALEKNGEIPTDTDGVHLGVGEGWWYETLGLQPTFSNWAQITFLHMYMLQVRFRMLPDGSAQTWIQNLTNHVFYMAEDRLVMYHKFEANSVRQKHLKDMFSQWRGVLLSYDEGLVKGDAMFAAAIWRNLMSSRDDVDFEKLAQIVAYVRRELKRLDMAETFDIVEGWTFSGDPGDTADLVKAPSKLMAKEGRAQNSV
ncbi:ubiquinol-cytochrome C chaperone-domain-containing protein [Phaeosphaeriaceae sp. PMI808]|nr:ubiquinol-cytochrome C chaperone-domain-containing protein [Phaeosphaeriaceae sp. PMI808]